MNWSLSVNRLRVGDEVKVICPSSQWRDARGIVTEVIQGSHGQDGASHQECAVKFKTERRWFMAEHLVILSSPKLDQFVRGECSSRWPIDSNLAESINVNRDSLIIFLCDHFGFSSSRAALEVDDVLTTVQDKLRRARDLEDRVEHLKVS
jgi:hypothetical protein